MSAQNINDTEVQCLVHKFFTDKLQVKRSKVVI